MRDFTKITPEKNRIEEWLPVRGYEGLYVVSDFGQVKSLTRDIRNTRWGGQTSRVLASVILKPQKYSNGYHSVSLCKKGKPERLMVHRIVAQAFLPNPKKKKCVNHKNGDKGDNRLINLEWATHSENNLHAIDSGLMKMRGADNPYASGVKISNGIVTKEFKTQRSAAEYLGVKDVNVSSAKIRGTKCKGFKITKL